MSMQSVLTVDSLAKRFPVRGKGFVNAVNGVSFDIAPGETLGLVGESGCGKSTVGKMIMKLHEPSEGAIMVHGKNIAGLSRRLMKPVRRQVQTIFQDPYGSLNPRMTAGAIVGEPLKIHGLASGRALTMKVAETFEKVGLRPDQMTRFAHEFSGGQRQRLSIARALIVEPEVIVADEPVSALDVSIQASVINLLISLQKEMGLSLLFISHDMSVVEHISHRVAVMYLGRIVEIGPRKTLFASPQHPYTQALLSAVPVADPSARKRERIVLNGDVPSPVNPPSGCHFHTRCPIAEDICRQKVPPLKRVATGQKVACHLREGVEAGKIGAA
ncbi:dipeptide ABC transporter ATP-binding protein [Martelella alba]|uniref:Dipeptide ABC transporter ATP-binding protein n=1 Tax=Martelella alba TaxID=2590451 RepID=A0A506U2J1_9HYPH|nr:dipeptide ABC transporter ATP-binding protein [Martelella alba]TPW27215.1 dipeptide ABC transporter ATP-binding protein [Martelella alba]